MLWQTGTVMQASVLGVSCACYVKDLLRQCSLTPESNLHFTTKAASSGTLHHLVIDLNTIKDSLINKHER